MNKGGERTQTLRNEKGSCQALKKKAIPLCRLTVFTAVFLGGHVTVGVRDTWVHIEAPLSLGFCVCTTKM